MSDQADGRADGNVDGQTSGDTPSHTQCHIQGQASLPASHHGAWRGPNRLWIMDPANPFRSDGTIAIEARAVRYAWSHEGHPHAGSIELRGQPSALKASWRDSFHAAEPFTLHGFMDGSSGGSVLRLFTTYDAGDECWGWQIELDLRDPEACTMRMFNVMPGLGAVPAVVLNGTR